jgi:lipid A 4'-phosphatase
MRRPLSRHLRTELLVALALLAAFTAVFRATRLDLAAAGLFREPCCGFTLQDHPFWQFVYRYGVFAGVLLAAGALVALTLSYWYPRKLHAWRRPALFLVLVATIGPGLVVNVVFKDHFGRPRPRDVVELGGQERFLPVWVPSSDRQAKSFPCGHCSMGFYIATPWLVLKRRRRRTALAFLVAGVGFGLVLGAARMIAGGHFLSDVVWSAGMVWLTALALYYALDLDRADEAPPLEDAHGRRRARVVTVAASVALTLLTGAALLATPYVSAKTFTRSAAEVAASRAPAWEVSLDRATVSLDAGPDFQAAYEVRAFGFPTSKMGFAFREGGEAAVLGIDRMGWFTERRTDVRLRFPAGSEKPLRLRLGQGKVTLDARGFTPAAQVDVEVTEGEVRVIGADVLERLPGVKIRVERGSVVRE